MSQLKTDNKYNPSEIEARWQAVWGKEKIYSPNLETAKNPFYNLMMFPYPSAEGMHVGNMYAFTGADVYGRFQRMQGKTVFEPIGLDGFGIHSENYAIKAGMHPAEQAKISEKNFYRQLKSIGNGFDWARTVETYKPEYYKWTQWLFIQLFKAGLAYRKKAPVNFCPSCKTVLADEQVVTKLKSQSSKIKTTAQSSIISEDPRLNQRNSAEKKVEEMSANVCERCETEVVKKDLEQWFFKITKYADRLLDNLTQIDWAEKVKIAQKQWIGKSEGARVKFKIKDLDKEIEVFTTRPDTLFGATFLVLSPEHPLVASILNGEFEAPRPGLAKLKSYVEEAKKKTEQERGIEKEKTGVFAGLYAINPVNKEKIPVWIADYVLMGYGTGAIMAVPAHDLRDYDFAVKHDLPIVQVIAKINAPIRSYLMGGEDIRDEDLRELGIKILNRTEKGYREIEIPKAKIKEYEKLIERKMTPGFWNEYVAENIVFNFKFKDGRIKRFVLDSNNEEEIDKLGAEFNGKVWTEKSSVWKWVAENDTYTDLIIHDEPGIIINSNEWNGIEVPQDLGKVIEWLEKKGIGKKEANYHLRDWLISRQRYWGPPIPMINCPACAKASAGEANAGWQPVPEKDLPVKLPFIEDYKPLGTGQAPLASHPEFYKTICPKCGGVAKRETDVSDTFLDSAWYFLRYVSTDIETAAFDRERVKKWLPVNMYIGGVEHSVLHLLYSRFITMALHDLGLISFEEPFTKFRAHGLIIKDGAKMSKSKGNVVIPDAYIKKFGADSLRTYLMFMGPFSQGGDFRDTGIEGMSRFLRRVWMLAIGQLGDWGIGGNPSSPTTQQPNNLREMHKTIKKVTEDISNLSYNTAIAALMEWYNFLFQQKIVSKEEIETFLKLLAPLAPHISEELFSMINADNNWQSIHVSAWPTYDPKFLIKNEMVIVVQVNGKLRGNIMINAENIKDKAKTEDLARKDANVAKHLEAKEIKKVIYIEGKVINFVVV
ncbi:MAG: leucyl-tRNA synthetase, leucyl-tRNA synthetase [Candidatus Levybacteria bacterium]|nr:leucyl-tRNA synthetase, leucyl-tRNA synthetase [Candidatus Levybacteria bacterium]